MLGMYAQSTTSLRGVVTDPQGAVITGAAVTLMSPATSLTRTAVSSEAGEYQFLLIPPGSYRIKAEKPGFSTLSRTGLTLQVNTPATLDLKLEVGLHRLSVLDWHPARRR